MPGVKANPSRSKPVDDRIVVIDERLRKVFHFYISLFPNYREAGRAVGVGKDTIAKYATESNNMAYPIYLAMTSEIQRRVPRKQIVEVFGRTGLDRWPVEVRSKNGSQIDNVVFEITPGIRRLIQHFTAAFPNRSQAARALDLNPRTLKAYANGQIQCFPRSRFKRMVDILREHGEDESVLLEMVGSNEWEAVIRERTRSETLYMDREQLLERLVEFLAAGDADLKDVSRPIYNACRRYFGALGPACDAAMDFLVDRTEKRGRALVQAGKIVEAQELVLRFERALRTYTAKIKARVHAARRESKLDWQERVIQMVKRKDRIKDLIQKESQFHPDVNSRAEHEKIRFAHPYLRGFRVYSRDFTYRPGELLFHPLFGMGRVVDVIDRGHMRVSFSSKHGAKLLAFQPERHA